jgi:hypothetical protein
MSVSINSIYNRPQALLSAIKKGPICKFFRGKTVGENVGLIEKKKSDVRAKHRNPHFVISVIFIFFFFS